MNCENVKECAYPKTECPNHKKCCDCVIKHRETDSLPFCLFPDNDGDKSVENYYRKLKIRFEKKSGGVSMRPKIDDKKCGASESICPAIKACPVGAISYIEVDEPIKDRVVNCTIVPMTDDSAFCGCGRDDGGGDCGGSPYGRIIIDYDKCTGCGICAEKCCGNAIDLI